MQHRQCTLYELYVGCGIQDMRYLKQCSRLAHGASHVFQSYMYMALDERVKLVYCWCNGKHPHACIIHINMIQLEHSYDLADI